MPMVQSQTDQIVFSRIRGIVEKSLGQAPLSTSTSSDFYVKS